MSTVIDKQDHDRALGDAFRAIADGTPLDWRGLETTDPGQADVLHLLDDIANAYRANVDAPAPQNSDVLFRWGGLAVEQRLGEGSYGEVWRAYDPWLGRYVALKLFRRASSGGLDEARRLARLRHRSVLSVYGCGVHDGRTGLWSELIEGRTLADTVAAEGAFSREEALRVGRDLAQALAVVHAAGLVHGDVKAENVMRESGGRIVLMDFGAGGDERLFASRRLISATPRYLPPEVLDGAPLGIASDIYALGMLLFFLLSGKLPYSATDAAALREQQRAGDRLHLRDLRPELDVAFCSAVESCIADDPRQRPPSAQALGTQLSELLAPPAQSSRRMSIVALAAAGAALVAVAALALWPRLAPPAWENSVRFLRVEPAGDVEIAANSTLRVGDRLRLSLRSSRDAWVYVLNEDAAGNATVLFPLVNGMQNPLHGGAALTLPGGADSTLAWEVTADSAREEFVVISSLAPLPALDGELAAWQRAHAADATRAVGAIVNAPAVQVRGEHLRRVLSVLDADHVRVWKYTFVHAD